MRRMGWDDIMEIFMDDVQMGLFMLVDDFCEGIRTCQGNKRV